MKKIISIIIALSISITFCSCMNNGGSKNAEATTNNINTVTTTSPEKNVHSALINRLVHKMDFTALSNIYFSKDEIVSYRKLFDFFLYAELFNENEQIDEKYKEYFNEKTNILKIPCELLDSFLCSSFNTEIIRFYFMGYDEKTETYETEILGRGAQEDTQIFSIKETDNNLYEVKMVKRCTISTSSSLPQYKKMMIEINDEGDKYKIISIEKLEKQNIDYQINTQTYSENGIEFKYPVLKSNNENRQVLFDENNKRQFEKILGIITTDKEDKGITKLNLNYEVTYKDFYMISILFCGKASYNNQPKEHDAFYTLTCSTIAGGEPSLRAIVNIDQSFMGILHAYTKRQTTPEQYELFKDYYEQPYTYSYFEKIDKFNATETDLILYLPISEKDNEYVKIKAPLFEFTDGLIYDFGA